MSSIIAPAKRVNLIPAGIVAGILGAIVIDLYLMLALRVGPGALFQWVASNFRGEGAAALPGAALQGAAVQGIAAIVWGVVYAALAQSGRPALVNRPVICGLIYGVAVLVIMQAVQVLAHHYSPPNAHWDIFAREVIGHAVFFGVPIALYVSFAARRALRA